MVANVPLLAFAFGPRGRDFPAELRANPTLRDNCTHFELFPTMLVAMVYPRRQVRAHYGDSLLDWLPLPRKRVYVNGPISRLSELREFPPEECGACVHCGTSLCRRAE